MIWENEILISVIHDVLFFLFVNHARDPPCTTLIVFLYAFLLSEQHLGTQNRLGERRKCVVGSRNETEMEQGGGGGFYLGNAVCAQMESDWCDVELID